MKRILICFGYKGSAYSGYQKQPNKATIQQVIEDVASKIFNETISIYASGRTDAGVHAIKQYAHFDISSNIDINKIPRALNTYLPPDIKVYSATQVDDNFHARYNVFKKTYMYVFSKNINPLIYDMVTPLNYNLDFELLNKAIRLLKGTHNFKAFCSANTNSVDFTRTIYDIIVEQKQDYVIFKLTGNGFLYNMVRIIVGTLVDVARGAKKLEDVQKMLETGDRSYGGKTVSPTGLYLFDVEYK